MNESSDSFNMSQNQHQPQSHQAHHQAKSSRMIQVKSNSRPGHYDNDHSHEFEDHRPVNDGGNRKKRSEADHQSTTSKTTKMTQSKTSQPTTIMEGSNGNMRRKHQNNARREDSRDFDYENQVEMSHKQQRQANQYDNHIPSRKVVTKQRGTDGYY